MKDYPKTAESAVVTPEEAFAANAVLAILNRLTPIFFTN